MTNTNTTTATSTTKHSSSESKIEHGLSKVANVIKDAFHIEPVKPDTEVATDSNQFLQGAAKIPPKPL